MKIALATDLSLESGTAAERANQLADRVDGEIELIYVVEPEYLEIGGVDGLLQGIQSASPVESVRRSLKDQPDIQIKLQAEIRTFGKRHIKRDFSVTILEGRADRELSRYTIHHDFLVIGAPANTLTRFGIGSVTERLCHRPHTRTLIVTDQGDPLLWVVAVDFSDKESSLILETMNLARKCGAKVQLVHVMPTPLPPSGDLATITIPNDTLSVQALRQWSETELEKVLQKARAVDGVDVESRLEVGYPVLGLCKYAEEVKAGLIVMGSHGRGRFEDVLLGSVAWGVIKRMPTSVLLIPAQAST